MKNFKPGLLFLTIAFVLSACNTQTSENQKTPAVVSDDLQVFYFHNTKRCATCNAVEDETRIALELFYEDQLEAGSMEFTSLNLEEEEGKKAAQSLQVSGQTLLIVKGESRVNLTNEGFMNARTNPSKFHEILRSEIDKLL
jgi:hypothetical protein